MIQLSDRFDIADKVTELHNGCIDIQRQNLIKEINWLEQHYGDIDALRSYFIQNLSMADTVIGLKLCQEICQADVETIQQYAVFRRDEFIRQLQNLSQKKVDTLPLKIAAQGLKNMGW